MSMVPEVGENCRDFESFFFFFFLQMMLLR